MAMAAIFAWGGAGGLLLTHLWRGFLKRRGWLAGTMRPPWMLLALGVLALGIAETFVVSVGFAVMRPPGSLFELRRGCPARSRRGPS